MIDRDACTHALRPELGHGSPRCGAEATHDSVVGRLCTPHAEELRERTRNPVLRCGIFKISAPTRTDEQVLKFVWPLPVLGKVTTDPVDRALLASEWTGYDHSCPSCGMRVRGLCHVDGACVGEVGDYHFTNCAHDRALTARGFPDQDARNRARLRRDAEGW